MAKGIPTGEIRKIIELRAKGEYYTDIAKKVGVCVGTVGTYVKVYQKEIDEIKTKNRVIMQESKIVSMFKGIIFRYVDDESDVVLLKAQYGDDTAIIQVKPNGDYTFTEGMFQNEKNGKLAMGFIAMHEEDFIAGWKIWCEDKSEDVQQIR